MESLPMSTGPGVGPPLGQAQWHSEADAALRQQVTERIIAIFAAKRGSQSSSSKMMEFVRRLEDGVYKAASSQAEYADPATLEARLQAVARRCFNKTPNGATRPADGMQQQQEATSGLAPNNQFVDGQQQGGQLHQMQQQQSGGLMHNNLLSSMSNPMNSSPLLNGTAGASMLGREGPLLGQVPGSQQYAGSQSQQQQQQYMQQHQQQYMQQHQQHQQQLQHQQQQQQQQQQMNSQYSMHQMANGAAHGLRGSSMMPNGVPAMVKGARDGQSPYLNGSQMVPTAMHGNMQGGPNSMLQSPPGPQGPSTFVPTSSTGPGQLQGTGSGMGPALQGTGSGMVPMQGMGSSMVSMQGPGSTIGSGQGSNMGPMHGQSMGFMQGSGMGHSMGSMQGPGGMGPGGMGSGMVPMQSTGGMGMGMQGSMGGLMGGQGTGSGMGMHMQARASPNQGPGSGMGSMMQGPGSGMVPVQGLGSGMVPVQGGMQGPGSMGMPGHQRQSPGMGSMGNGMQSHHPMMGGGNSMQQQQQQQQPPMMGGSMQHGGGMMGGGMQMMGGSMQQGGMMGGGMGMGGGGMGMGMGGSGVGNGMGMSGGGLGMGAGGMGMGGGMQPPHGGMVPTSDLGMSMPMQGPGGSGMVPVDDQLAGLGRSQQQQQMQAGPGQGMAAGHRQEGFASSTNSSSTDVVKKQRWLLFLRHCAKCKYNENECTLKGQCKFGKHLWNHILTCTVPACAFPRCSNSKELLKHHQKCLDPACPVCVPVKEYINRTRQTSEAISRPVPQPAGGLMGPPIIKHPQGSSMHPEMPRLPPQGSLGSMPMPGSGPGPGPGSGMGPGSSQGPGGGVGVKRQYPGEGPSGGAPHASGAAPMGPSGDAVAAKRARVGEPTITSKDAGTSLLEAFTWEQIQSHTDSLRAAAGAQRAAQTQPDNPEDACQVCGLTKLLFEPAVVYCNGCGARIKRGQTYYITPPQEGNSDIKGAWCHPCHTETKADKILLEGSTFKKQDLIKTKNESETEEGWVQCDACQCWVHQICGLFNKGRNNQETHYLCPTCLQNGLNAGTRQPLAVRPQSMLDARELPHTQLSVYLEEFMANAIEEERKQRAKMQGLQPHQVPGAEGLSVRVVNSVLKKCETRPRFVDAFSGADGYPADFPYRQRVVVLFQNLDGVDVCLFVMYVQEYGPMCPAPNTNCVYLSYLDSVKYFRPENVMAVGCPNPSTSLRTFVYHQLQVAYLSYVQQLGFEQMFIWACPPMQGDDYILYCHPAKQKTPRSDRLRMWYHDMLKDARNRGIVRHLSTLWDTFFEGGKDHKLDKCSALHIPYLEGDYWPGEAENLLGLINDSGKAAGKKDGSSGGAARKGKRAAGGPATTDAQLMSRLGEILGGNMKEDFIVVHLKEVCTFCRRHIESGCIYKHQSTQPVKNQGGRTLEGIKVEGGPSAPSGVVTSLSLCETCFRDEQRRFAERGGPPIRLPMGVSPERLEQQVVKPVQKIQENVIDIECEHFETRLSFLNLCQGNHYQFDTIRRAKHSSMMVLYHLHNPEAPAFTTTCNICSVEIEPGTGFRCTVCPDFDMCISCQRNTSHPHPMTKHVQRVDETRMRLTEQQRRERNEQLQRTMELLVHACSCNSPSCASSSCKKVKAMFRHSHDCPTKVTGGCQMCKKIWALLNLHAKGCTTAACPVPKCRQLRELRRQQAARQEDARRMAYQNMLRKQMAAQQQGKA